MKYLLTIILNSIYLLGYSQCDLNDDFYQISNQTDLETLFHNNPDCTEIDHLFLYSLPNENDPIIDLTPLNNIQKVNTLQIRNIPELKTLFGLENIDSINILILFSLDSLNNVEALFNLENLNVLTFSFNSFIYDVSQFNIIKPRNSLTLIGDGYCSNYEIDTKNFRLRIFSNTFANDFTNMFVSKPDSLGLVITNSFNLSFQGFENYERLTELFISGCENCSFNGLENLNTISNIFLQNVKVAANSNFSFSSLTNIEYSLGLAFMNDIQNFSSFFPALKYLGNKILLMGNDSLYDISILSNLDLPTKPLKSFMPEYFNINQITTKPIYFYNNKSLDYCSNNFICEALTTYPDSVFIEGNGTESCQYQGLFSYCNYTHQGNITFPSSDGEKVLTVYPNPTGSFIKLDINVDNLAEQKFIIFDMIGNKIKSGNVTNNQFDVIDLKSGNYLLSIFDQSNNLIERFKFVKI